MTNNKRTYLTYAQVADELNVSTKTVRRMVAARTFKVTRLSPRTPRIKRTELERVLERRTINANDTIRR